MTESMPRTRASQRRLERRRSRTKSVGATVAAVIAGFSVGLIATGVTYALWNSAANVNASSVSSGTFGLTINGGSSYVIPGLNVTSLGPGQSVVAPFTVANTGSTKLAVSVTSATVGIQSNSLASWLQLTLTASSTCTVGLTGGTTGDLVGFTTTAYPTIAVGGSQQFCLQVTVNPAAPSTAQGGNATFTLALTGTQVRP
jgi:hypothetical protein